MASGTNWPAYIVTNNSASFTTTGAGHIGNGSGLTNILGSNVVNISYEPYSSTGLVVFGTCSVTYAMGPLVRLDITNNTTLTFNNPTFPSNGVCRVAIELQRTNGAHSVSFLSATISNATAPTITTGTNVFNSLFFRRTGPEVIWKGRQ